jgi:hypothetical protein
MEHPEWVELNQNKEDVWDCNLCVNIDGVITPCNSRVDVSVQ